VLSREDTRNSARDWLVANVPPIRQADGTLKAPKIVVEPVVPDSWAQDIGDPAPFSNNGNRWSKFSTSRANILNGKFAPGEGPIVNIEDYEKTLTPELVQHYAATGYCYVVSGSTQRGRAEADPGQVPRAVAYYRALDREATVVHRDSPYGEGDGPVEFNFDWSFDFYPLAYHRPGPEMVIYRLHGGECGP
jgi:hypothetical protein